MTARDEVGFTSLGTQANVEEIARLGVGMLGYAFMGKAHTNGYKKMPYIFWPPPAVPDLVSICGSNKDAVAVAARRFGFEKYTTVWQELIDDPHVQLLDNSAPNHLHAEPCIAAVQKGKHVLCEKPLARTATEAKTMWNAAERAGVKHMCNFNYRLVPALCLARQLITNGRLGRIFHFRAQYLQEWIVDPQFPKVWRMDKKVAGSGALGDFSHIVDLARWLCGEPELVSAITTTFVEQRPSPLDHQSMDKVEVDDAFEAVVRYRNGAIGFLEGSRFCPGRKNYETVEINAEKGSIHFNLENMNYLNVYFRDDDDNLSAGFHAINVTESSHPYMKHWWPHGHIIGWENTFVHMAYHMCNAILNDIPLAPEVATFEDGYKAAVICDAILESARTGRAVAVQYDTESPT
jgi:predicted dehydrogenase